MREDRGKDEWFYTALSDLNLPRLGGRVLKDRLQQIIPRVPVIFISDQMESLDEEAAPSPVEDLLPKPFSMQELTHKVRNALDRSTPA